MIIWLNGAYGAGKSTIAQLLHQQIEDSFIFDPEMIGNCVRESRPALFWKDDFQEYPLWREMTYRLLKDLYDEYTGTIIVPMTVLHPQYFDEVIGRLERDAVSVLHILLMAKAETIQNRILKRGEKENCWCMRQVERCVNTLGKDIHGIEVETDDRDTTVIAAEIQEIARRCKGAY